MVGPVFLVRLRSDEVGSLGLACFLGRLTTTAPFVQLCGHRAELAGSRGPRDVQWNDVHARGVDRRGALVPRQI